MINGRPDIKMKKNKLILFIMAVSFVVIDQLTKLIVFERLKDNDSIVVIKNILNFTYVENRGAAWGMLSGRMNILVLITIIVIPLLLIGLRNTFTAISHTKNKVPFYLLQVVLVMIISGALGNFIDRIVRGFVVDFIQVTFMDFPVFNIADCFITVGAVLFIIDYGFFIKEEEFDIIIKGKKVLELEEKEGVK